MHATFLKHLVRGNFLAAKRSLDSCVKDIRRCTPEAAEPGYPSGEGMFSSASALGCRTEERVVARGLRCNKLRNVATLLVRVHSLEEE